MATEGGIYLLCAGKIPAGRHPEGGGLGPRGVWGAAAAWGSDAGPDLMGLRNLTHVYEVRGVAPASFWGPPLPLTPPVGGLPPPRSTTFEGGLGGGSPPTGGLGGREPRAPQNEAKVISVVIRYHSSGLCACAPWEHCTQSAVQERPAIQELVARTMGFGLACSQL